MVPPAEFRSYYDRPVLKEPVWKAWIPGYFFAGGVAAGSSLLAEAAAWSGDRSMARRARATALVAVGASTVCLVADLGRPSRFHHMLRVAKVTSPVSVGSWLLAAYGPLTGVAAFGARAGRPGVARAAAAGAAALAPVVATYTGVLVADTAIPVWHDAYRELPFVFAGGAAASAGALGVLMSPRGSERSPAVRLALLGAVAELAATVRMRHRLGPLVGEVYDQGTAGRLERVSRGATVVGAGLLLGRRRGARTAGATLVFAGAALQRFAIAAAGHQSARDPKYVVVPQRARLEANC
ncbi:MAG TPA: NrfD/PsrC family molybdoenzyme membrane anchor subunit [Acidimicrobiia bacterium]